MLGKKSRKSVKRKLTSAAVALACIPSLLIMYDVVQPTNDRPWSIAAQSVTDRA